MSFSTAIHVINQIRTTSSRNAKIKLFTDMIENDLTPTSKTMFQTLAHYIYEPTISFGVKWDAKWDAHCPVEVAGTGYAEGSYQQLAEDLMERRLTGNSAITNIEDFLINCCYADFMALRYCLLKSFDCGIDEKTIRRTMPGVLTPKILMMKCEPANAKTLAKITYPARLELKIDAMRVNAIVVMGQVDFITYNGTRFNINNNCLKLELVKLVERLPGFDPMKAYYVDGELMVIDENGEIQARKVSNGQANRLLKATAPQDVHDRVHIVVWDVISQDDMDAEVSQFDNETRFAEVCDVLDDFEFSRISLVPYRIVQSIHDVDEQVAIWIAQGEEGGVLKQLSAMWEGKRSKFCIKFKSERECELRVTGIEMGDPNGNRAGKIGALICESACGKLVVNVGGGLSEEDVNQDPTYWLDQIITVRFNEVITKIVSKTVSLFLPRMVEKRNDKDEADTLETILSL